MNDIELKIAANSLVKDAKALDRLIEKGEPIPGMVKNHIELLRFCLDIIERKTEERATKK